MRRSQHSKNVRNLTLRNPRILRHIPLPTVNIRFTAITERHAIVLFLAINTLRRSQHLILVIIPSIANILDPLALTNVICWNWRTNPFKGWRNNKVSRDTHYIVNRISIPWRIREAIKRQVAGVTAGVTGRVF
ncbi:hypothetical protein V6N13_092526 [Hibiscus sabdariffa]